MAHDEDPVLEALAPSGAALTARELVDGLGLRDDPPRDRPRVVAMMIASADGRAAVDGRSVGLGCPADRELLRELRAAADAILVGAATLVAERYANLLDDHQRTRRAAAGLEPHPVLATVSRRLEVDPSVPVFAEAGTPVAVFTEAAGEVEGTATDVVRMEEGELTVRRVLEHLHAERGVRLVTCEGGPGLLAQLVAESCADDLLLTVAPLLVGGDAPATLGRSPLGEVPRLMLRGVRRAGDHLFLHYAAPAS